MPGDMSDDDFESTRGEAVEMLEDESDREGQSQMSSKKRKREESSMSDADLACLRRKFPFLADLSDNFVKSQTTGELLKMETTAMKMRMLEQSRDYEDRLATNKMLLGEREMVVPSGIDNRWDKLHQGRFLPGATCTTKKQWLEAKATVGLNGSKPLGSYDMSSVGMGGFITSKGWCEIHNPGSTKMSLRLFSINNCASKAASSKNDRNRDDDVDDIVELGEFKLALRTMRVAASMAMPWNFAYVALENFLHQTNFFRVELQGVDQPAKILTQFVDYVIKENANRWRDGSGFLDAGSLRSTWDAFFGAKPQSQLTSRAKGSGGKNQNQSQNQKPQKRLWVDICFEWNIGKCLKPVGTCVSSRGTPLRHVCNFQPDRAKQPNVYCEKAHARTAFH